MKTLKVIGWGVVGILAIYALYAAFVPMMIGQKYVEREVIQQSPQYVISQRSAMYKLHTEYQRTDDPATKKALETRICQIGQNIPRSEWNNQEIVNLCQ